MFTAEPITKSSARQDSSPKQEWQETLQCSSGWLMGRARQIKKEKQEKLSRLLDYSCTYLL